MSRSTVGCTFEQRFELNKIKKELASVLGYMPKDSELMEILIKTYRSKEKDIYAEIITKTSAKLMEILNLHQENLILKTENEKLKQEIDKLKEKSKKALEDALMKKTPRELWWILSRAIEEDVGEELATRFRWLGEELFDYNGKIRKDRLFRIIEMIENEVFYV